MAKKDEGNGTLIEFQIGKVGVDLVSSPHHTDPGSWTQLQNAEFSTNQGRGGVKKRGGLSALNGTALAGRVMALASIPLRSAIDSEVGSSGIVLGSPAGFLVSSDGISFTLIAGAGPIMPTGPWELPALVLDNILYYIGDTGGGTPGLYSYDGTTIASLLPFAPGDTVTAMTTLNGKVYMAVVHTPEIVSWSGVGVDPFAFGIPSTLSSPATANVIEYDKDLGTHRDIGETFGVGGGDLDLVTETDQFNVYASYSYTVAGYGGSAVTLGVASSRLVVGVYARLSGTTGLIDRLQGAASDFDYEGYPSLGGFSPFDIDPETESTWTQGSSGFNFLPSANVLYTETSDALSAVTVPGSGSTHAAHHITGTSFAQGLTPTGQASWVAQSNVLVATFRQLSTANPTAPFGNAGNLIQLIDGSPSSSTPIDLTSFGNRPIVMVEGATLPNRSSGGDAVGVLIAQDANPGVAWFASPIEVAGVMYVAYGSATSVGGPAVGGKIFSIATAASHVVLEVDVISAHGGNVYPGQPYVDSSDLFWPFYGAPGTTNAGYIMKRAHIGGAWTQVASGLDLTGIAGPGPIPAGV